MTANANPAQASAPADFIRQRANMIEQQVRPWNVLDDRVLGVMSEVAREEFVPERFRELAYSEARIPLGCGQEMIQPSLVGRMLQALRIEPRHRILEIGTGSGYLSACLSRLGKTVATVEIHEPIFNQARVNLERCANVEPIHGNALTTKLPEADILVVNASCAQPPEPITNALGNEGRALMILGSLEEPMMAATLIEMKAGIPLHRSLFETWLAPLISK